MDQIYFSVTSHSMTIDFFSALPNEQNEEQAKNIVICLLTIIQKNCHDSQSLQYLCDTVIKSIYKLVITSSMYPVSVLQQTDVLDRLSMCVRCIATRCNNRYVL
jgi:hypothetical protein